MTDGGAGCLEHLSRVQVYSFQRREQEIQVGGRQYSQKAIPKNDIVD